MKISSIKKQVKRTDRYSVYVDGEYIFSLSETALLESGLFVGRLVTADELGELKDTSKRDKAYNQALGQIARRARSEWEIRSYLKRKEYDPELIDQIVGRLYKAKLLDDVAFAKMWIENRRLLKATSKRRLQQELRQKRISDEIINKSIAEDDTDDSQVLKDLVSRKRKILRYQDDTKLIQYLIRQGYNYDDVKRAVGG